MPEPSRWYVSYTVKSDRGPRRHARRTRTFDTEEHAKLFVRELAAGNQRITAGTINPHSPKKVIAATEVAAWLEAPVQLLPPDETGAIGEALLTRLGSTGRIFACRRVFRQEDRMRSKIIYSAFALLFFLSTQNATAQGTSGEVTEGYKT
jgi:hypothetical protein